MGTDKRVNRRGKYTLEFKLEAVRLARLVFERSVAGVRPCVEDRVRFTGDASALVGAGHAHDWLRKIAGMARSYKNTFALLGT